MNEDEEKEGELRMGKIQGPICQRVHKSGTGKLFYS